MKSHGHNAYSPLCSRRPVSGLEERIHTRIVRYQTTKARQRAYVYGITAVIGITGFIPAIWYAHSHAAQSGLYSYLSLFVSDSGYAISNVGTLVYTVIESLPVAGLILVLITLIVALYAAKSSIIAIKTSRLVAA